MSGLSGFGHDPGVRRLPRPGFTGRFPELVSVQRLPGRRSCGGSGHRGSNARDGCGRGVRTSVPCRLTVRTLSGRTPPARGLAASRPASRPFPAPPRARQAASSRVARRALPGARVGVQPATVPGVPSRDAGKAAASSRWALPTRRASVVSTVSASERVETTPGDNRRTTCKALNEGDLWASSMAEGPLWGRNARKRRPRNGCTEPFSPDSLAAGAFARPPWNAPGRQAVGSGRVIPDESLAD